MSDPMGECGTFKRMNRIALRELVLIAQRAIATGMAGQYKMFNLLLGIA